MILKLLVIEPLHPYPEGLPAGQAGVKL